MRPTTCCRKRISSCGSSGVNFKPGSNFKAWAFRIAHFQFMAYRQQQLRDKTLFSDDLLATLASEARDVDERHEERAAALERCLERMPARSREAIRLRYADELKVSDMAEKLHRSCQRRVSNPVPRPPVVDRVRSEGWPHGYGMMDSQQRTT